MPTKLDKPLKREVIAGDDTLVLTLTPDGVTITPKGKRKGKTFRWVELWSGEAELAARLRASLQGSQTPSPAPEHSQDDER
jgi:hypothetical protein